MYSLVPFRGSESGAMLENGRGAFSEAMTYWPEEQAGRSDVGLITPGHAFSKDEEDLCPNSSLACLFAANLTASL